LTAAQKPSLGLFAAQFRALDGYFLAFFAGTPSFTLKVILYSTFFRKEIILPREFGFSERISVNFLKEE
jgi:hypothetical protein